MKNLLNELQEFNKMLQANVNCDWDGNDPSVEFEELSKQLITIIVKAEKRVKTPRDISIEKLGHYISEDDIEAAFDKLIAADDQTQADDVVCMWEPLEYRYTVSQLLEEVS